MKSCRLSFSFVITFLILASLFAGSGLMIPAKTKSAPADCYWVGGTGLWSDDDNHWATSSNGTPGDGNLPDSGSNVHFDEHSFTGTGQKVSLDGSGYNAYCNDMDWTGALYNPTFDMEPAVGSTNLKIYGSLTFIENMSIDYFIMDYTEMYFDATTTGKTITLAGQYTDGIIRFTGSGGWTFQDDMIGGIEYPIGGSEGKIYISSGTVNFGNNTLDLETVAISGGTTDFDSCSLSTESGLSISGSSSVDFDTSDIDVTTTLSIATATIDAGSATINCATWDMNSGSLTCGTSTITVEGGTFDGDGETYYSVNWEADDDSVMTDSNTFTNLTITCGAIPNSLATIDSSQTITGTLNMNGHDSGDRLNLFSDTFGTNRTLTAATVSASYVNFRNITGAGAGSWDLSLITGGSGDCGGNIDITFTAAGTSYLVDIFGNTDWSDTSKWAASSGGGGGSGRVPLPQDIGVLNAYSIYTEGVDLTLDQTAIGGISVSFVQYEPTFMATTANVYNSISLGDSTWTTTTTNFYGNSAQTWATDGTFTATSVYIHMHYGSLALESDVTISGKLYLRSGIFNMNDYDFTCAALESNTTTFVRNLILGDGTLTLNSTSDANKFQMNATNLSLYAGDSTIVITSTSTTGTTVTTGSKTYNDLTITGSGNYTVTFSGSATFEDIRVDRTDNQKGIAGAVTLTLTGGFYIPTYGTTIVTIANTDFTKSSGLVYLDYMTISGSTGGGGATYLACHSTDGGGNSGWTFDCANSPVVSALAATDVDRTSATLNGGLDSLGSWSSEGVYISFQYGLTTSYTDNTSEALYTTTGTKSAGIAGLDFNTSYHFRIQCRYNDTEYVYGDDTTFLTLGAPVVTTLAASDVSRTTATLNGLLVDLGDYSQAFVYFEYGTTQAYGYQTIEDSKTAECSYSAAIAELPENITIHYRAVARYETYYYTYGSDMTFTTLETTNTPLSIGISNVAVHRNACESGDRSYVFHYSLPYADNDYPEIPASRTIMFRLYDSDNTTLLQSTDPYVFPPFGTNGYGEGVGSFYFDSDDTEPSWEEAVIINIVGLPAFFTSEVSESYVLTEDDYTDSTSQDDNQEEIKAWVLDEADELQGEYDVIMVASSDMGRVLSYYGDLYFRGSIPGIQCLAPGLFLMQAVTPEQMDTSYDMSLQTNYTNRLATDDLGKGFTRIGEQMGVSGSFMAGAIAFALTIGLAYWTTRRGWGTEIGLLGGVLICVALMILVGDVVFVVVMIGSLVAAIGLIYLVFLKRA